MNAVHVDCTICHELCLDAMRCGCSEGDHIFCRHCILQWIRTRSPRPTCPVNPNNTISVKSILISTMTRNIIADRKLRCKGCKLTGITIKESSDHVETHCPAARGPCSNAGAGCTEIVKRHLICDHHEVCQWKQVTCAQCFKWSGPLKDLPTHVETRHKPQWVLQPCTVCRGMIRKCYLQDGFHKKYQCLDEEIECQFKSETRCEVKMKRRLMGSHHDNIKEHFKLALKVIREGAANPGTMPKIDVSSPKEEWIKLSKFCGEGFRLKIKFDTDDKVAVYFFRDSVTEKQWSLEGVTVSLIGDAKKVLCQNTFLSDSIIKNSKGLGWSFVTASEFREFQSSNSELYFNVKFSTALMKSIMDK
jgi:hypothetical protein